MDNVAKEFDKKLNQVHEHYKTMQKKMMGDVEIKL